MAAAMVCEDVEAICEPKGLRTDAFEQDAPLLEFEGEVVEATSPSAGPRKHEEPQVDHVNGADARPCSTTTAADHSASERAPDVAPRRAPLPQTSYAASRSAASDRVAAAGDRAAAISASVLGFVEKIKTDVADVPAVRVVADVLGVRPIVVVAGAIASVFGFLLFGLGGQFVCMVVGALYPAFESFKVIESGDPKGLQFWLTYWVVYSAISCAEHVGYYILVWLPFYYPTKLGLLVWLASPSRGGTLYAYRWFISPFLLKNRDKIDEVLTNSSTRIRSGVKRAANGVATAGMDAAKGAGMVGARHLRHGMSLVRPGLGTVAGMCLDVAATAAARSRRAVSGDVSRAKAGGDREKVAADGGGSEAKVAPDAEQSPSEGPVGGEPQPEPGIAPCDEPQASLKAETQDGVADAAFVTGPAGLVEPDRRAEVGAAEPQRTVVDEAAAEPPRTAEDGASSDGSELVPESRGLEASTAGGTSQPAVPERPGSPGKESTDSLELVPEAAPEELAGGFFGEIRIPSDMSASDMDE
mmetsp:Transcript_41394/g.119113  ORF Transcript_41394/g.119113 Transcript_41394/m.119113 type:complete len:528 (+) Transcript_41394:91-1674(+)